MANKRLPTIGITCLDDQPTQDQHDPRFGQSQAYVHAVATPWPGLALLRC